MFQKNLLRMRLSIMNQQNKKTELKMAKRKKKAAKKKTKKKAKKKAKKKRRK